VKMGLKRKPIDILNHWKTETLISGITPDSPDVNELDAFFFNSINTTEKIDYWKKHRNQILKKYIEENPGKRPWAWWSFDAPRWQKSFNGAFFEGKLPEPRERVGGVGTPENECLGVVPTFTFGIPDIWVSKSQEDYYNGRFKSKDPWMQSEYEKNGYKEGHFKGVAIDPENLPTFESQASYLKRHNLLKKSEERRLKPADFEPENCLK